MNILPVVASVSIGAIDVDASFHGDLLNSLFISFPITIGSGRCMKQKKGNKYKSIQRDWHYLYHTVWSRWTGTNAHSRRHLRCLWPGIAVNHHSLPVRPQLFDALFVMLTLTTICAHFPLVVRLDATWRHIRISY